MWDSTQQFVLNITLFSKGLSLIFSPQAHMKKLKIKKKSNKVIDSVNI